MLRSLGFNIISLHNVTIKSLPNTIDSDSKNPEEKNHKKQKYQHEDQVSEASKQSENSTIKETDTPSIFGMPINNMRLKQYNTITFQILLDIIKSNNSLNYIKAQILNLFYFHTNLIYIEYKALELLVKLNDPDINEVLRLSMCNITCILTLIIENNNFIFFTECINDKTRNYNRISVLCKIAQTNLKWLNLFVLNDNEINYILRIALVHINDKQQLINFIIDNMNKLDNQQVLEMAIDYNNKEITLFMLNHAIITIQVLYLSIYHEELFKILYSKIDKNILNITEKLSIIEKLELQKIENYKKIIKI